MTVKESIDQVVQSGKCLVCESPAVWLRHPDERIAVACGNSNCHWSFGWILTQEDLIRVIDDKVLSAEVIE